MTIPFSDFYPAVPEARVIYDKHQNTVADELFGHSQRLGRWVMRAEKRIAQTALEPDPVKQEITDKLITKLVTEILVSPYDRAPFETHTDKCPVLFKGQLFPRWMFNDIVQMIGMPHASQDAILHHLMIAMLEWSNSLVRRSQSNPSPSSALIPATSRALMALNQVPSQKYLDGTLLVNLNFAVQPELTIIKLIAYRDLIKKAFRELELRTINKGARRQLKQIVQFSNEQKKIAEAEKTQIAKERASHEQAINKQLKEIVHMRKSTQEILKANFQSLIDELNHATVRMKSLQEECKNKEAQIQALEAAQRNLKK